LTGRRLTTVTAGSLADAAHIRQFARSGNDEIGNGLALSEDAHWAFDCGLRSLPDACTVLVAVGCLVEERPDGRALREYHGRRIRLPTDRRPRPGPVNLGWHRRHELQIRATSGGRMVGPRLRCVPILEKGRLSPHGREAPSWSRDVLRTTHADT
jgi:hypothetical protein